MKEYLEKNESGNYVLISAYRKEGNDWIEVPEGAESATIDCDGDFYFWNLKKECFNPKKKSGWFSPDSSVFEEYEPKTIWQREIKYKEFLNANDNYNLVMLPEHTGDDERSGLIEVPGSQYNFCYKSGVDFAWTDKEANDYGELLWQRNTEKSEVNCGEVGSVEKHSHYFKDFSGCKKVDVYRVLDRFDVVHPCQQHIAKKALCAGNRGHKDLLRDIQDIIDTAERWKEMLLEDSIID